MDTKKMVLSPSMCLEGIRDLPPPCAKRKNSFAVEIYQVDFLGTDWRVWREDLVPVMVSITASEVENTGRG